MVTTEVVVVTGGRVVAWTMDVFRGMESWTVIITLRVESWTVDIIRRMEAWTMVSTRTGRQLEM